mgnify:FL=1
MLQLSRRETKETCIDVVLETEGSGRIDVETEIELLDMILTSLGKGANFDLRIKARGDSVTGDHHTIEDTGITLGKAIAQAIKSGIGSSTVPSSTALAVAAVRFGETGYRGEFSFKSESAGGMTLENFGHFLRALAYNGGFTLVISAEGGDDMSKIEAMSTALGRAIRRAWKDSEK